VAGVTCSDLLRMLGHSISILLETYTHFIPTMQDEPLGFATKDRIGEFNPLAEVHLLGQEVNPETFTMCKSDL
jgi:hypothetical protein